MKEQEIKTLVLQDRPQHFSVLAKNSPFPELVEGNGSIKKESARKCNEKPSEIRQTSEEVTRLGRWTCLKIDGFCARFGVISETSFYDTLRDFLEEVAHVQVVHVNEFDDEGFVFGRPDQVELDVVIHNGMLILCEMKSWVSKADVSVFERKAQFYEKRHQRSVTHKVIISPWVDPRALPLAQAFGMFVYSNAEDVVLDDVSAEEVHTP